MGLPRKSKNRLNTSLVDCQLFRVFVFCRTRLCFIRDTFFSTQPQCSLTFSQIEPQVLVGCCLIHISIIILRHFLCLLVYVSPCLDVGLFMSYLCDLLFFFTFIIINHIISLKQNRHTWFFAHSLQYAILFLDDNVDEESR